jgi:hypothetical protein
MDSTPRPLSTAPQQYLAAERVIDGMSAFGRGRVRWQDVAAGLCGFGVLPGSGTWQAPGRSVI